MAYNPSRRDTYYRIDEYGLALCMLAVGYGVADCIGRGIKAAIAYFEESLLNAIIQHCIIGIHPVKILRHPECTDPGISRDHVTYLLIGLKYFQKERLLKILSKNFRWRISDFACFTPDMWCWMKGIAGSKFYRWLFYRIEIPWMRLNSLKNRIYRWIAGFHPEYPQDVYDRNRQCLRATGWRKWVSERLYPAYALQILAWQLYVLPDTKSKRRLQRVCLKMTGRYNYLIRILFGDRTVTLDDVNNYKHMTTDRWGVNLDETNDRDTYIITDPNLISDNAFETDLLKTIWLYEIVCAGNETS